MKKTLFTKKSFDISATLLYNSKKALHNKGVYQTMKVYTIGIDYGTLSGRAVLVDTRDGRELATAAMDYPHGVMDTVLAASGAALPPDYALQDPADYLLVLRHIIPEVLKEAVAARIPKGTEAANFKALEVGFNLL